MKSLESTDNQLEIDSAVIRICKSVSQIYRIITLHKS